MREDMKSMIADTFSQMLEKEDIDKITVTHKKSMTMSLLTHQEHPIHLSFLQTNTHNLMDIDCLLIVNLDKQEPSSYSRLKRPPKVRFFCLAFGGLLNFSYFVISTFF